MRIAFLVGEFPSLSQTFILNQIIGLLDRGHDVDIYSGPVSQSQRIHDDVMRYKLLERTRYRQRRPRPFLARMASSLKLLAAYGWKDWRLICNALNVFRFGTAAASCQLVHGVIPFLHRPSYDIIHAHFAQNGALAVRLRDLGALRGRILTTFHGHDVTKHRDASSRAYPTLFKQGDGFTCSTTFINDRVVKLGCAQSKLRKLPVGVNLQDFKFQERRLIPGEPIRIITVARLVEKKGVEYSIRAVAQLANHVPKLEYRIVGDGPLHSHLQHLIVRLGMESRIKLLGAQTRDAVIELFSQSHLFVLSSVTAANGDMEGQGLVIQEAQAMGLPVVSTLHNGIPDGVLDRVSGFLVPERDVDALAERLLYLAEHPETWPEMGRAGRTFVEDNYDIENLNDRLVRIYEELLADGGTS